ncbi:hypothetical protein [Chryseobacterium echinoideorum]|uniref:hypothetical protein n=1 Tax=Chryseobacterium echinoideorum TaxID=1549648 RepID=UPI0011872F01|nr:hypothetical protein [Chryseobacterium echinoideorum]
MKILKFTKEILLISAVLMLSSCALKSIPSDYNTIKLDIVNTENLGDGKVLIYNGAGVLHSVDNTARLNVWVDGKSLGQIKAREYLIVDLNKGNHEFKILHIDMVNMRSTHQINVDENTKVVKLEPTITSNKATVTNILPENFDKYRYRIEHNK